MKLSTTEIYSRTVRDVVGETRGVFFEKPSMTQQQFKDDCNINSIIDKYKITGALPVSQETGIYGDFTSEEFGDYQSALNLVKQAQTDFDSLPAKVRERFGYSPASLFAFLCDKANYDEAVSLGLVKAQESSNKPFIDDVSQGDTSVTANVENPPQT